MTDPVLVAEPIRGWRRAFVTDDGFGSIVTKGTFGPGWSEARCRRGRLHADGFRTHDAPASHPVPSEACRCGWYACADREALPAAIGLSVSTGNATLAVELAGRVIEWQVRGHDSVGYRAARQRVVSVALDRRCTHRLCDTSPVGVAWPGGWPACDRHAADVMLDVDGVADRLGVPVTWGEPPFAHAGIDLDAVQAFGDALTQAAATMAEAGAKIAKAMSSVAQTLTAAGGVAALRAAVEEAEKKDRARSSPHRPGPIEHLGAYQGVPINLGELARSPRGDAMVNALAAKRAEDRRRQERLEELDRRRR